jgi:hypothetical protein
VFFAKNEHTMSLLLNTPKIKLLQVLNVVFFVVMIIMNGLAVGLPLNGKSTGQLSEQYPNLFVPAGLTFSVWSVIYLLLAAFCIFQLRSLFSKTPDVAAGLVVSRIGFLFVASSVFNSMWIVAWHYEMVPLSVVIMLGMLWCLFRITDYIEETIPYLNSFQRLIVNGSFGIYFGWICIATIANVTALLVSLGWDGAGLRQESWAAIMIVVGTVLTAVAALSFRNAYIGMVVIWAFVGIIIKRYDDATIYRYVVYAAGLGIVVMSIIVLAGLISSRRRRIMIVEPIVPVPPQPLQPETKL